MNTNTNPNETCQRLFGQWQDEHRQLNEFTDQLRSWIYEIAQLGIPHFGETADKLTQLRHRLQTHFEREDAIGDQLTQERSAPSVEIEATRRQATLDHDHLLRRLGDLIDRLSQPEAPFESWEQAAGEVSMFIDALDEHEEQESASITWLSPPATTKHPQT